MRGESAPSWASLRRNERRSLSAAGGDGQGGEPRAGSLAITDQELWARRSGVSDHLELASWRSAHSTSRGRCA
jgi:hypothetical protein